MASNASSEALRQTIEWLEEEHRQQQTALTAQFRTTYDSIKPLNVLKDALTEMAKSSTKMEDLVIPLLGLGMGYLTKKLVQGKSQDPNRAAVATVVGDGIANVIAMHPVEITAAAKFTVRFLFGKGKSKTTPPLD